MYFMAMVLNAIIFKMSHYVNIRPMIIVVFYFYLFIYFQAN